MNTSIFIDAEYLLQSLRELTDATKPVSKTDFDFAEFIKFLSNGNTVSRVGYYTARLDKKENIATYNEQTAFLDTLKKDLSQYNVDILLGKMIKTKLKSQATWDKTRTTKKTASIYSWGQKGVDTKIVLDMCKYAYSVKAEESNRAVLVSGDEDFSDVSAFLKETGVFIELVTFDRKRSRPSKMFTDIADKHIIINYNTLAKNGIIKLQSK